VFLVLSGRTGVSGKVQTHHFRKCFSPQAWAFEGPSAYSILREPRSIAKMQLILETYSPMFDTVHSVFFRRTANSTFLIRRNPKCQSRSLQPLGGRLLLWAIPAFRRNSTQSINLCILLRTVPASGYLRSCGGNGETTKPCDAWR
jgi:hypothetical protein